LDFVIVSVPEDFKLQLEQIVANQHTIFKNNVWLKLSVSNLDRKLDTMASTLESHQSSQSNMTYISNEPFESNHNFLQFDKELKEDSTKANIVVSNV